jgi:MscS family membrane protein
LLRSRTVIFAAGAPGCPRREVPSHRAAIRDGEGVVEDALLTIPNSDLTTAHLTNFGARRPRQFRTRFSVDYATPPERLIDFRDGILCLIREHAQVRQEKYEVAVSDLGSSGVEVLVQVFFDVSDGHEELVARDGLILDVLRLADRLGIAIDTAARSVPR